MSIITFPTANTERLSDASEAPDDTEYLLELEQENLELKVAYADLALSEIRLRPKYRRETEIALIVVVMLFSFLSYLTSAVSAPHAILRTFYPTCDTRGLRASQHYAAPASRPLCDKSGLRQFGV